MVFAGVTADQAGGLSRRLRRLRSAGRRQARVMILPGQPGAPACFDCAGFNGRGLGDDVMDVMLSLAADSAPGDGVAADRARIGGEFPYFRAAWALRDASRKERPSRGAALRFQACTRPGVA